MRRAFYLISFLFYVVYDWVALKNTDLAIFFDLGSIVFGEVSDMCCHSGCVRLFQIPNKDHRIHGMLACYSLSL